MGGACCVAARDKNIVSGPSGDILHRNIRYSPTWSFRWDNRGRVAGEDTSISWFSDGISRNDGSDIKFESNYASEDGSPVESFRRRTWQKSPTPEVTAAQLHTPASDQSISRNISMDTNLEQVKESTESSALSNQSPAKLSLSLPSTSSLSTSPLSSQSHLHPAGSTTSRWPQNSPRHQIIAHSPDARIPGLKSSNSFPVAEEKPVVPSWSNESTQGSHGGSSDGWSMHAFSELMATSHRERWSFDNECVGFNHEKTRSSGQNSASPSVDLQTCGVCLKLLIERSLWSSQKLILNNELPVVAVLTCGHVYHAECLEVMTPEIDKYDPACPICSLGEKQAFKLSQKALKAEMDLKAKNKKSRNRVVDGDVDSDSVMFDRLKTGGHEGKGPKMASSSSMKSSLAKPFLRRHFSFVSRGSKSSAENHTTRKKGFFWTRSMRGDMAADLRDEYGNPIQLTDEHGCPVQLTDEHGNPVHITGIASTKQPPKLVVADAPDTGKSVDAIKAEGVEQSRKVEDEGERQRVEQDETSSTSSGSSEDDGQGGRRKKKKGLTQKIKEKLTGGKPKEEHGHTEEASTITSTGQTGEPQEHEKKSMIKKIKEKLPGHHNH